MVKSEVGSNIAQNDPKGSLIVISIDSLVQFSQQVYQNWKMAKSEVGSNIAQNDPKWSLIVLSIDILVQFSQKVDQNWKMAQSEVGSNIAQNDPKWSYQLIFWSNSIKNLTKTGKWPKVKLVRTLLRMTPN